MQPENIRYLGPDVTSEAFTDSGQATPDIDFVKQ